MDALRYADTIVALATGEAIQSAVAVIRCSGTRAFELAERACTTRTGAPLALRGTWRLRLACVAAADGGGIDEVLVAYMRGPRSFTGEDVVEFHCHGGLVQPRMVLERLCSLGARLAEPGEFTRRAVVNGRLSLPQAEALGELVAVASETGAKGLLRELLTDGARRRLQDIRESMVEVLALVEGQLDVAEADEATATSVPVRLQGLAGTLEGFLPSVARSRVSTTGPIVTLVGEVNVGKSSLFNALVRAPRAIVTEHAGTTRDVVEERVRWGGVIYRLQDTAGRRPSSDAAEREGIRRAYEAEGRADVVVEVRDATKPGALEGLPAEPGGARIVVANKWDAVPQEQRSLAPRSVLSVSALTGEGVDALATRIGEAVSVATVAPEGALTLTARQRDGLARAITAVGRATKRAADCGVDDVVAEELREAATALDGLVAPIAGEEVLDQVFKTFCVGK